MKFIQIDEDNLLSLDEFIDKFPDIKNGDELSDEIINNAVSTLIDHYQCSIQRCEHAILMIYDGLISLRYYNDPNYDIGKIRFIIRNIIFLQENWDFKYMDKEKLCKNVYKDYQSINPKLPDEMPEEFLPMYITDLAYHLRLLKQYAKEDPEFSEYLYSMKGVL